VGEHPRSSLSHVMMGLVGLSLTACALGNPPVTESGGTNLTAGMVKTEVTKGVTTQAEILEVFGAPNIITLNSDEDEVWNYHRMAFVSTESASGVLAILWGGWAAGGGGARRAAASATTRSFDLILTFDEKDVVKEYKVISAVFDR